MNSLGVNAEEAIFVGDGLKNDIEPAKLLGIKTIWLNHKKITCTSTIIPDFQVERLNDVLEYIR